MFEESDVIARSVKITNTKKEPLKLKKAVSCSLDVAGKYGSQTDMIFLGGTYAEERMIKRRPLAQGATEISSRTGESSHYLNPFVALCDKEATRASGDVLGAMLVYSGNHRFQINVDPYDNIRIMCGINDEDFAWTLAQGETFQTPECLLCFSGEGIGA